ncbi:MAG: DNA adenine methylase, partial [Chloroflexota bacterium]
RGVGLQSSPDMEQGFIGPSCFMKELTDQIVNITSVPMRSPFRYPGGKTWLVPHIRRWFASLPYKPTDLIEPFAGGAIVGLTVAFEQLANHVTLGELDDEVAAVWQTILSGEGEWLAQKIASFDLSTATVRTELSKTNLSLREKAFQTILRNRLNRGGILAPGAGMLKNGDGKGLASRWYPKTLQKRILDIAFIRDRIGFIKGDGIEILKKNAYRTDIVFFIDPPYTVAGKKAGSRLYTHSELDHEELFRVVSTLAGDFLMSYSDDEWVYQLAQHYNFGVRKVSMKNTHHTKMTELLIGRNLAWVVDCASP